MKCLARFLSTPPDLVPDEIAQAEIDSGSVETSGLADGTETEITPGPVADILFTTSAIEQADTIIQEQPDMVDDEPVADTTTSPVVLAELEVPTQAEPVANPISSYRGSNGENIFKLDNIPARLTGILGSNWYRIQPRTSYTLQLISASDIGNVIALLEDVPGIQAELSGYVKYTPSGKPRYLMFYGLYADQDTTAATVANLPEGLKAVNPWPRSIGNITDAIDTVVPPARQ